MNFPKSAQNERCVCGHGSWDHSMSGECLVECAGKCKVFNTTGEVIPKRGKLSKEEYLKEQVEAARLAVELAEKEKAELKAEAEKEELAQ